MKSFLKSRQNGFAIIEALIAFLLLGIGVAALLYLQGNLMSGSNLSKARAEAMELAKDRSELLRNYIHMEQFKIVLSSVAQESIPGVNAIYTLSYEFFQTDSGDGEKLVEVDAGNPLSLKEAQLLKITVRWQGNEVDLAGNPKLEEITQESMLFFSSPTIASAIDSEGGTGSDDFFPLISPFITGVQGKHSSTDEFVNSPIDETVDLGFDDAGSSVELTIKTYADFAVGGTGHSNIEILHDVDGDGVDEVVLTSFGGIVHRIEGEIIVDLDSGARSRIIGNVDVLNVLASPPSYCVFPVCMDTDADCIETNGNGDAYQIGTYVCYVPGDCTHGSVNDSGVSNSVTGTDPVFGECNENFKPPIDLNGGWYGRVGNFSVHLDPDDMVCTTDTYKQGNDTHWTPSREYVTKRHGDLSDTAIITGSEGINTPYSNQTFLITRKKNSPQTACPDRAALYPEKLVDEQIKRQLYGVKRPKTSPLDLSQDNVVFPLNECLGGLDCPPPPALLP